MRKIGKVTSGAAIVCLTAICCSCTVFSDENTVIDSEIKVESQKTQLKLLYSRDDITWSSVMDDLCSKFENENADIDLELQSPGNGIYEENLKVKEALDEFPDLFEIQNADSYVVNDRLGVIPEKVSELIEEPQYTNKKVYTVPLYTTTYGIVYNQVLFKKYQLAIPETYEDFMNICRKLADNGVVPITCGGTKADSVTYWLNYFYQKDILAKAEPASLREAPARPYERMMMDYADLINSELVLKDSIYMNDSQIISQFLSSKVAMYYTKPSFIANIILADPDCMSSTKDNMGVELKADSGTVRLAWFFIPTENGDTIAATEVGSRFAISKECMDDPKRYEAAERFLLFLLRDDNYRQILKSMYGFQTTKKRVLYPAPVVQQYLIVDYRYAKKEEAFLAANHISGGLKNELYKKLNLLLGDSITAEEMVQFLKEVYKEKKE